MNLLCLGAEDFNSQYGEALHTEVFGKKLPEASGCDFALVVRLQENVLSYVTVRRLNDKLCFLEFGGATRDAKHTIKVPRSFLMMIDFLFTEFSEITMSVRNTNFPMLKLALKLGFVITGTQITEDRELMLLHTLVKGNE